MSTLHVNVRRWLALGMLPSFNYNDKATGFRDGVCGSLHSYPCILKMLNILPYTHIWIDLFAENNHSQITTNRYIH